MTATPQRCRYRGIGGHNGEVLRTATLPRALAAAAVVFVVMPSSLAAAVPPPIIDPGALPPAGPPSPAVPMRQFTACTATGLRPGTDPHTPSPAQTFMNPAALWAVAGRGAGVTVAVIDTGVSPSARLPHLHGGGDYVVAGGDGLADCDAHGTIVASIIGGNATDSDAFTGVAPDANLISIRQLSAAFSPVDTPADPKRTAESLSTLSRAIVHAADLGAKVINLSVALCIPVDRAVDQSALGAAVHYAATEKDAVVVAGSGNIGATDCLQNPSSTPSNPQDPRNWAAVATIGTPSWFADYVLSVSATDDGDRPAKNLDGSALSLSGPWVGVAAPGVWVQGLNERGEMIDGEVDPHTGQLGTISGTSFAAAYVTGLSALIRAKFPELTAAQVIQKIESTARTSTGAVDNEMGHGVIDPIAALSERAATAPRDSSSAPPAPPHEDAYAVGSSSWWAVLAAALVLAVLGLIWLVRTRRRS
jgi:membrane-anchored mycosin MYCP